MRLVRPWSSFRVLLVAVLALALMAGPTASAGPGERRGPGPDRASLDELAAEARDNGSVRAIVTLRADFEPEGRLHAQARASQRSAIADERRGLYRDLEGTDHRRIRAYPTLPFAAVELSEEAVEALGRSEHVAAVVIDQPRPPALEQSSPLVEADLMWNLSLEGAGHLVAILDTGVDTSHAFFGGRVVEEACYSTNYLLHGATSLCPEGETSATGPGTGANCEGISGCGHGTHVAGIAAGSGTFHGVARGADIMSVQVFSRVSSAVECLPESAPCLLAYITDIVAGLERVYQVRGSHDIAAANLSLGGGTTSSACDTEPEKPAIDQLRSANIATVISSGNDGRTDGVSFPACVSTAVAVGSTTKADVVSGFSNGHPTLVDLLAPGSSIRSSVSGGDFTFLSGTSMAAPHVAGAWALIRDRHPSWSVDKVLAELKATGLPVTDTRSGAGYTLPRIRVHKAAFTSLSPSCGQVVTGEVVLLSNLVCSGHGLIVGSAGADIDLNGFVLRGPGTHQGVVAPASMGAPSVAVRNGVVRGFANGVVVSASSVILEDLTLAFNGARGARIIADGARVSRVTSVSNGVEGMFARVDGGRIDVDSVVVRNNGGNGLRLNVGEAVVRDGVARDNLRYGIVVRAAEATLELNRVVGNGSHGLVTTAEHARIDGNIAHFNTRLGIAAPNVSTVTGSNTAGSNNAGGPQCRPGRLC